MIERITLCLMDFSTTTQSPRPRAGVISHFLVCSTNKMNMSNETDIILAHFEKISSVPRGTKYEAGIRQWLIDWAGVRGFKSQADAVGNLFRSEERRVGKEGRSRWWPYH